jgi:hypothetical protein
MYRNVTGNGERYHNVTGDGVKVPECGRGWGKVPQCYRGWVKVPEYDRGWERYHNVTGDGVKTPEYDTPSEVKRMGWGVRGRAVLTGKCRVFWRVQQYKVQLHLHYRLELVQI